MDFMADTDSTADIATLAASLPPKLAPVIEDAHELANLITPAAIGSAKHNYRLAEARLALATATNTLSAAVVEFQRVSELLKGV
jgi:hypothetical protein